MARLTFTARLRLLPTDKGGRSGPIFSNYRPSWDLGNTWLGEPTLNDARVLLADREQLAPGDEATVRIEPFAPEFWGNVRVRSGIPMQEGRRVVGHAVIEEIAWPAFLTREVAGFVSEARQFCAFVEKAESYPLDKRVRDARTRLLALYAAGALLPRVDPPDEADAGASPFVPSGVAFDKWEIYWKVFDPYEEDAPVAGALSEDVLDTYRDVRRGLRLWDSEVPKSAAIWEWRFHVDRHWGDHAIDALRALHRACVRIEAP